MENSLIPPPMPLSKTLAVLLGFPIVSTLISLLLLNRSIFSDLGLDFFSTFWVLIIGWYSLQIFILSRILKSAGWGWKDIGYSFDKKRTGYFIGGFLIFAFALLAFIEFALAGVANDPEKLKLLSDFSNLTPKTTMARVIFIFMALVAGLCEELVYRGFAINALKSLKVNKWLAILIAAIPFVFQHGLKSIDQFWWFFIWGIVFGLIFTFSKKLTINIVIHWLVILSALLAILQVLK